MKFVRLSTIGMHTEYENMIGIEGYDRKQEVLFSQMISYTDSVSFGMKQRGYDAHEIVYDCEELQNSWAKEHGCKESGVALILKQLQYLKPDILYLQDIHAFPKGMHNQIKKLVPSLKMLIIFRGYPGVDEALFHALSAADLLLVGSPILLNKCRAKNLNPKIFYHFFDERVLNHLNLSENKSANFVFCGSSGLGYGMAHASRYYLIKELLKRGEIETWIDEIIVKQSSSEKIKTTMKSKLIPLAMHWPFNLMRYIPLKKMQDLFSDISKYREDGYPLLLPTKPLRSAYPQYAHKALYGLKMYKQLAQSKLVLNKHSNCAANTADNIRLFQATGVGSCLLTDGATNLSELFEPDKEIVTYSSIEECLDKAHYLLNHDAEREEIARNGQLRTLKDHTLNRRCEVLDQYIRDFLLNEKAEKMELYKGDLNR